MEFMNSLSAKSSNSFRKLVSSAGSSPRKGSGSPHKNWHANARASSMTIESKNII